MAIGKSKDFFFDRERVTRAMDLATLKALARGGAFVMRGARKSIKEGKVRPRSKAREMEVWAPGLGTNGAQLFVWGFFISTVALLHGTFFINSLAHVFGGRRFKTEDTSRNSLLLALLTLGEGWHNNHHRYMHSAKQGFYWWEIDISYYVLKMLSWVGIIWDLRPVPAHIYEEARIHASRSNASPH